MFDEPAVWKHDDDSWMRLFDEPAVRSALKVPVPGGSLRRSSAQMRSRGELLLANRLKMSNTKGKCSYKPGIIKSRRDLLNDEPISNGANKDINQPSKLLLDEGPSEVDLLVDGKSSNNEFKGHKGTLKKMDNTSGDNISSDISHNSVSVDPQNELLEDGISMVNNSNGRVILVKSEPRNYTSIASTSQNKVYLDNLWI